MYPNEITSLYNELRGLTEQVKSYYALPTIIVVTDSVLIFIMCVTTLTLNYTNKLNASLFHDHLLLIYCLSKLLFVFFIVREAHNTMQEVRIFDNMCFICRYYILKHGNIYCSVTQSKM